MSNIIHYKEILELPNRIHYLIRKTKKDLSVFYKFYAICKNYKPDIVHCWDDMTAVISILACKLLKIKLVNGMVIDAPQKRNVFNKSWFRASLTFPFSDKIVGNSKAGIDSYNAPKSRSVVIRNGFDFHRIRYLEDINIIKQQLKIKENFVVGMVATFSEKKDYKTYIRAAQSVLTKRKDVVFLLIGQYTDSGLAEKFISDENMEHFRFLGKKNKIESYINLIDVCVLATFTEGISNSIMEYMALGKPVIATSGGGTNEIVEDKKTGFLVNVSDVEDMANKIETLLNNGEMRIQMGERGRERIRNFFSIELMLENYIFIYSEIINKKKKNR